MKNKSKYEKRRKVPVPVKIAIAIFGAMCILIAIVGSVHAQTDPGTIAVGEACLAENNATGNIFVKASCLTNPAQKEMVCTVLFDQDNSTALGHGIGCFTGGSPGLNYTGAAMNVTSPAPAHTHHSTSTHHKHTHHNTSAVFTDPNTGDKIHVDTSGHSSNGKNQLITEHPDGSVTSSDTGTDLNHESDN